MTYEGKSAQYWHDVAQRAKRLHDAALERSRLANARADAAERDAREARKTVARLGHRLEELVSVATRIHQEAKVAAAVGADTEGGRHG